MDGLIGGSLLQGETRWVQLVLSGHVLIINLHTRSKYQMLFYLTERSLINFEDSNIILQKLRSFQPHIVLRMSDNLLDSQVDVVQLPAL